jgi:hypothetical protein
MCVKSEVKVGLPVFSYMQLNVCWFSEVSFQLGTPSIRNEIKLKVNPVWNLKNILFNIEGYGEFFSGITPTSDRPERKMWKIRKLKDRSYS